MRRLRNPEIDIDQDKAFSAIYERCAELTMTSKERMYALYSAIRYLVSRGIAGDIVECGVWKGGSMMLAALTLLSLGDRERKIYLYDTFHGMTAPTAIDVDLVGRSAADLMAKASRDDWIWAIAPLDEVKANLGSTGFPEKRLVYVVGDVMETIPRTLPPVIALLRLDTDWYESTVHELEHLYPLVPSNGVVIVDDYGHFQGQRKAVDEYFASRPIFWNRIDYTGRLAVKTP